jgi:hypothetical protein
MGGPDDGAEFIVIKLDQGEEITIKISDIQTITRDKPK